ncbi:MAG: hypothetical protein KatS3mg015_1847 [Fimbriimonadales bacterium]|nr:MAG: hypothetical protein KatS3mg015_1847 [Fimbriimonadales bacterium]
MTLFVEFDRFADAVRRHAGGGEPIVYLQMRGLVPLVTFYDAASGVHIISTAEERSVAKVQSELAAEGFTVEQGLWVSEASIEHMLEVARATYVVAVAYEAAGGPGVWMDAYPYHPTEGTVLRAMFEEFVDEGLLGEDDFELFLREAQPLVRVLTPEDAERFIEAKVAAQAAEKKRRAAVKGEQSPQPSEH